MKVTNHHNGNYTFVDITDSSVMYGTITMTRKEFNDCISFLRKRLGIAKRYNHTYILGSLSNVFSYTLAKKETHYRVCLGVCATELIFKEYNLPRYKKQNYLIIIK